ncbi:hypothetical protein KS4_01660 [Poriferisphaera corsica]|uniref:PEP-CTERM protein-sorting domain-containing protein n=1 Tax=Poriferisphaera corsica TaxID=2528020 RepID=A0A517YPI7_9BACT|nr:hypothetical protein [Poriferisphaera corsica]QDU32137.1 hypothetical protein KS4_01660 [Poriferisphaera corsica]
MSGSKFVGAVGVLALLTTGIASGGVFETVVLSGEQSTIGEKTLRSFDDVDLNNNGQLLFQALVDDEEADESWVHANIYVDAMGGRKLIDSVEREGDLYMMAGQHYTRGGWANGDKFMGGLHRSQLNDRGDIAYIKVDGEWELNGGSASQLSHEVTGKGMMTRVEGGQSSVLFGTGLDINGQVVGDKDAYRYRDLLAHSLFQLNESGQVITFAREENDPGFNGEYKSRESVLSGGLDGTQVLFDSQSVDEAWEFNFADSSYREAIYANEHGDVIAFSDGFGFTDPIFYSGSDQSIVSFVNQGEAMPGYGEGSYLQGLMKPMRSGVINDNGTVHCVLRVKDPDSPGTVNLGLFEYKNDQLRLIEKSGNGGEHRYTWSMTIIDSNNNDTLVYAGQSNSIVGYEFNMMRGGEVKSMYMTNDHAAGMSEDWKYGVNGPDFFTDEQDHFRLNENDIAAMVIQIRENEDDPINAIYTYFEDEMQLVVHEGMDFEVMTDEGLETRVIERINASVFDLNNQNMLAFGLEFEDGSSGIFTTMVPEPMSGAIVLGAGLMGLVRRKRVG